jgi:hypothetical protein
MRQQLLDELFQSWLQEQLENLGPMQAQDSKPKELIGTSS